MSRPRRWRTAAVVLSLASLVACSEGDAETAGDDGADHVVQQEGGNETVVDWSEGLTQQEQLAEVEFVVAVMQDHFGEDIMRAENWTLEGFADLKGNPHPSHRASDHYFYRVEFDFSDVEANQETQEKALAVLEEIGLTPNGEQPTTYDEDRVPPLSVGGGNADDGRIFLIEQSRPGAEVSASFYTRHSDHQSMYEAHEASWEE